MISTRPLFSKYNNDRSDYGLQGESTIDVSMTVEQQRIGVSEHSKVAQLKQFFSQLLSSSASALSLEYQCYWASL